MSQDDIPPYLKGLNLEQLQAVTHDPVVPLQILAGPGSGKTRVLTSRVAYLVQHHDISPSKVCAVTFTNKAANEMRHRLEPLIGIDMTKDLIMGTFHAICGRFLRKHGKLIDLSNNFSICDADESKKIISKHLKKEAQALKPKFIDLKEGVVQSAISKAKSQPITPQRLLVEAESEGDDIKKVIARVFELYEDTLKNNNSLDFDDLLLYGVKLFKAEPQVLQHIEHILVDEFQDTSVMQYELVKYFAKASGCLTIVGDPDQSIYGWRAAEIENLSKMRKDFPSTKQIFLEENYRSSGAILALSYAIVAQDKSRINKGLYTSHAEGSKPVLSAHSNEHAEADFIASEIKRIIAYSGGMLKWDDFAILLRFNALSRAVESSFQKAGIPMRMLAGQRFFDRAEIKDILAYLQLADNPKYNPAFHRVVNVPRRSIGDKSILELEAQAHQRGLPCMEYAERLVERKFPASTRALSKLQKDLPPFVKVIKQLRKSAQQGLPVPELIQQLLDLIKYEDYLRNGFPDSDSRWENVQELINYAKEVSNEAETPEDLPSEGKPQAEFILNDDGSFTEVYDEPPQSSLALDESETPLRLFLQTSSLSTDTETSESDKDSEGSKVTISTCHAAKGLEWPVVFVPSVEHGTFPFYRSDDVEEERRLLYVACTRAQSHLYLSHSQSRLSGGESRDREQSPFITNMMKNNSQRAFFANVVPSLCQSELMVVAGVLRRSMPDGSEVSKRIAEHSKATRSGIGRPLNPPLLDDSSCPVYSGFQSLSSFPTPASDVTVQRLPPPFSRNTTSPTTKPSDLQSGNPVADRHSQQLLRIQNRSSHTRLSSVATESPQTSMSTSAFRVPLRVLPRQPVAGDSGIAPSTPNSTVILRQGENTKPNQAIKGTLPQTPALAQPPSLQPRPPIKLASGKRRLGMGRPPDGFGTPKRRKPS